MGDKTRMNMSKAMDRSNMLEKSRYLDKSRNVDISRNNAVQTSTKKISDRREDSKTLNFKKVENRKQPQSSSE